jgi:two-component sensor histidine kinase
MRHSQQHTEGHMSQLDERPDEAELIEQLPEDLDPHEMADSVEDELVAEEGQEIGLDPDLAVFASRDDLGDEELT